MSSQAVAVMHDPAGSVAGGEGIPVTCPEEGCGAVLGVMVCIKGRVRLDVGGWLIVDGMRHCYRCGRPFHFKPPSASWEEIVQRWQKRLLAV